MPLYNFHCDECDVTFPVITKRDLVSGVRCAGCGSPPRRVPSGPAPRVMERIDNGLMAKAVERPAETQRLVQDRDSDVPVK